MGNFTSDEVDSIEEAAFDKGWTAGREAERERIISLLQFHDFEFKGSGGSGIAGLCFAFGMQDDFTPRDLQDAEDLVIDAIKEMK